MSFKRVRSLPSFPNPKDTQNGDDAESATTSGLSWRVQAPDMDVDGPVSSYRRNHSRSGARAPQICNFWRQGRCNRDPCNFLHSEDVSATSFSSNNSLHNPNNSGFYSSGSVINSNSSNVASFGRSKRSSNSFDERDFLQKRNIWGKHRNSKTEHLSPGEPHHKQKPCISFLRGHCRKGKDCPFLHSFSTTEEMDLLTQLQGHEKTVRAIALPAGSQKLYTGGQDKTIRIWDCATGQCANVIVMGGDVGCLLTITGWLFIGLPDEVKALNLQTNVEQTLLGPSGQVHALAVVNDILLAGVQDGNILVWRFDTLCNMFQPMATLVGHSAAVVTLEAADTRLYSGSADRTIKVWDLTTGFCLQTLQEHSDVVMALLCWNEYLLSGSLDGTIRVWACSPTGTFDLQYTYPKDAGIRDSLDGVLTFCGFVDHQNKDILMCSLDDNSVHLFELPSFSERGILFSNDKIRVLQAAPGGLVFSGDGGGNVKVWRWLPPSIC